MVNCRPLKKLKELFLRKGLKDFADVFGEKGDDGDDVDDGGRRGFTAATPVLRHPLTTAMSFSGHLQQKGRSPRPRRSKDKT